MSKTFWCPHTMLAGSLMRGMLLEIKNVDNSTVDKIVSVIDLTSNSDLVEVITDKFKMVLDKKDSVRVFTFYIKEENT